MKITKAQLKQIIKEELEVTLTNEEAGEMFGVSVENQLNEQDKVLNEDLEFFMQQVQDPAAWELMARALAKIITNFAPAAFGAAAVMAVRRALGYDKDYEDEGQDMVDDTPVNEEEEMGEKANYYLFNNSNSFFVGPGSAPQEPNWVSYERASKMSESNAAWFSTSYKTETGETLELVKVKD